MERFEGGSERGVDGRLWLRKMRRERKRVEKKGEARERKKKTVKNTLYSSVLHLSIGESNGATTTKREAQKPNKLLLLSSPISLKRTSRTSPLPPPRAKGRGKTFTGYKLVRPL